MTPDNSSPDPSTGAYTLNNMLALSNGLAPKSDVGGLSSDYLSQLLQQNAQKKDSYWNSPFVAMAAGLLKGNDENGIPMSTGQALGQGLQNVMAQQKAKQTQDAENLRSAIYLRQVLGQDKLVDMWTRNADGSISQVRVKPEDVPSYQQNNYTIGTWKQSAESKPQQYSYPAGNKWVTAWVLPSEADQFISDHPDAIKGKPQYNPKYVSGGSVPSSGGGSRKVGSGKSEIDQMIKGLPPGQRKWVQTRASANAATYGYGSEQSKSSALQQLREAIRAGSDLTVGDKVVSPGVAPSSPTPPAAPKKIVRTGRDRQGRKVVQYSDGTIGYGN